MTSPSSAQLVRFAGGSTIGGIFRARARLVPDVVAIQAGDRTVTYAALNERTNRIASMLTGMGVARGDRVAILSENSPEYLELQLAVAKIGVIVACQNWRQATPELQHCINLVTPKVLLVSARHAARLKDLKTDGMTVLTFDEDYETRLATASAAEPADIVDPEDGLFILYTSGTTGLPKGAVISHRAEIARALMRGNEFGLPGGQVSAVWMPFFHMSGTEDALGALLSGGKVVVLDGFDPVELAGLVASERIAWLRLMPGMIAPLIKELKDRNIRGQGMRLCGTMADLVPPHQVAEITTLLQAPFVNSFGATETGLVPCSAGVIPIGVVPTDLGKTQTSFCELRLVDEDDNDVPDGTPGEAAVRSPTLFSGYWNAPEVNEREFRGGWFHMGDMFVRRPDGKLNFVDRVKYMIKSGGENIYPAEIERVLLAEKRVADAVVVKRKDEKWGEVPVAFVARKDPSLTVTVLQQNCRAELAGYKQPKDIRFIPFEAFPRSTTGKIQRHEIERWITEDRIPTE